MRVVVLAYHSNNILGNDYADNDHVALAEDLHLIHRLRLPIVSLHEAVAALRGGRRRPFERAVALSCDDGSWFDWHDLEHPSCGPQPSFRSVLSRFQSETQSPVHMTSFVIVSPVARRELDRTCLIGRGWWGDDWWPEARAGGSMAIESHSWDHNHATLTATAQRDGMKGTFRNIETLAEADAEIAQASDWLDRHCPAQRTSLFAYPYGETSEYLIRDYLPNHRARHRLSAAFTTSPEPFSPGSDPWQLGRYVCGQHWRSPDGLAALLRDALS